MASVCLSRVPMVNLPAQARTVMSGSTRSNSVSSIISIRPGNPREHQSSTISMNRFVKTNYKPVLVWGLLMLTCSLPAQNAPVFDADAEAQILADLNRSRAEAGVPALQLDPKLTDAARRHASMLAKRHVLSHQ